MAQPDQPNPVPGAPVQPSNRPIDEQVVSIPLEAGEDQDELVVVANESTASDDRAGGGEWPDPEAPPRGPAPGTAAAPDDASWEPGGSERP